MTALPYIILTVAIGIGLACQPPINSALSTHLNHSAFAAALISIGISLLLTLIIVLLLRIPVPVKYALQTAPWWVWLGGIVGVLYVVGAVLVIPKIGAAGLVSIVVTTQIIVSLVIDSYGLFGVKTAPVTLMKLFGAAFLILGVVMVRFA